MHDGPFNSFREVVDPHLWGCLEAFAHWPNTRSEQGVFVNPFRKSYCNFQRRSFVTAVVNS